jgi:ABC transport system ATP-binding/permease protein
MVAEYAGTLLLVSHDRAFLDNVVTSTLVFEGDGRVNEYVGGYSDWLRQRRAIAVAAKTPSPRSAQPQPIPAAVRPPARGGAAKPRKLSYKDQRELDAMPAAIQRLEVEQAELAAAIADPELFRRDPAAADTAVRRLQSVQQELEAAFARWEVLESAASP